MVRRMDRLERGDYFRCGLEILSDSGAGGLTISGLCGRLAVTKGSFYHHFADMPAFVTALLGYWESEHSHVLISESAAEPEPLGRAKKLIDIAVDLPHGAEASLRAWGRSNAEVARVMSRVDSAREHHLTVANEAVGLEPRRARRLANVALAILVGAQHRGHPVDKQQLRDMLEETLSLLVGDRE